MSQPKRRGKTTHFLSLVEALDKAAYEDSQGADLKQAKRMTLVRSTLSWLFSARSVYVGCAVGPNRSHENQASPVTARITLYTRVI